MRVWLDDVRCPPNEMYDVWVKTAEACIEVLCTNTVSILSLDHDLGENNATGYDVAKWIEEKAFLGALKPFNWQVHSQNPVGYQKIFQAMLRAEEYWLTGVNILPLTSGEI